VTKVDKPVTSSVCQTTRNDELGDKEAVGSDHGDQSVATAAEGGGGLI